MVEHRHRVGDVRLDRVRRVAARGRRTALGVAERLEQAVERLGAAAHVVRHGSATVEEERRPAGAAAIASEHAYLHGLPSHFVTYDEDLADRIRELVVNEPGLSETKMFGGLAFLIGGHMAVAASGQGGILVHVDGEEGARLVEKTAARPMVMRGKEMRGWLRVDTDALKTKRQLATWVERGAAYARLLPPKSTGGDSMATTTAYPIGSVPPVGEVPPRMLAQVVRQDRLGDPIDAFQIEEIDTPSIRPTRCSSR